MTGKLKSVFSTSVRPFVKRAGIGFLALSASILGMVSHANARDQKLYQCPDIAEISPASAINSSLYQGLDGWFFRRAALSSNFHHTIETQRALHRINRALAYHGIELVMLPMLPRGLTASHAIPDNGVFYDLVFDPDFSSERFDEMIEIYRNLGITVININELRKLQSNIDWKQFSFKRDIHWTPYGAQIVAAYVTEQIKDDLGAAREPISFSTNVIAEDAYVSNALLRAVNEACNENIPPEKTSLYSTQKVAGSADNLATGDTANDANNAVHLIGTSFTHDQADYNFAGFLREYLSLDISNHAIESTSVRETFYSWAKNIRASGNNPQMLLWEYSSHSDLQQSSAFLADNVVPAIFGICSGDALIAQYDFDEQETFSLKFDSFTAQPEDYYLAYSVNNTALSSFLFRYGYKDGETTAQSFIYPETAPETVQIFKTVRGNESSFPQSVTLEFGAGKASSGQVSLCKYPDAVFSEPVFAN